MVGPGRYDDLCTHVRETAKAEGAAVIVLHGTSGSGFSVQVPPQMAIALPSMLRMLADDIEKDFA